MVALFVKRNGSPLCEALCCNLRELGEALTEDPRESESILWFPTKGRNLTDELIPFLEQKTAGSVLVMLPYFLWEGDPQDLAASEWAGGLCAAVRALALRFAPDLRINCLRYGYTEADPPSPTALESIALGRAARVEEVARAALFLVKEGSSFMTGQSIDVNGGRLH